MALYFWAFFADVTSITAAQLVTDTAAISAGLSLIIAFLSYLWAPKKYIFASSLVAYGILCITTAILVLDTGGASSPFIALWMAVTLFAGIFGLYALVPLLLAVTLYLFLQFFNGSLNNNDAVTIILTAELPLILSYIVWHRSTKKTDNKEERAYNDLASELRQVAGKSEVVINAIADGVIALNNEGTIELINPAAQRLIGWGRRDALSLNYKSVLKLVTADGDELQPSTDPITLAMANNKLVSNNNLALVTNSGKKLLVSVVVSPAGQPGSGVIIVFRDVTKEKQEEREQAEFISTASHEMRTPVASIEGYLGLAMNPATAQVDEKARQYITKAHESAQHLGRLFQDLLDISKADDGRLKNDPKAVDVTAFVQDITEGLEPQASQKGLRMFFKPQSDDGGERRLDPVYYANVDNDHLREVVANVIENAIKYTPEGTVTIDVSGDNDTVRISVQDTGIGIPAEDLPHLFQKFYRVDNSTTREIGGTGLGLYLCRKLAEAMNGRIWAESQYKQGSTFYVEIPRISHEEAMRLIEEQPKPEIHEVKATVAPNPPEVQTPQQPMPAPVAPQPQPIMQTPTQPQAQQSYFANTPQPVAYQQPAAQPTQSQPQYGQPPASPNVPSAPYTRPNTPISSIEQDPNQYRNINIPPRN